MTFLMNILDTASSTSNTISTNFCGEGTSTLCNNANRSDAGYADYGPSIA